MVESLPSSAEDELITLAAFAILIGIDANTLQSARDRNLTAFPKSVGDVKKGFAKIYRKTDMLAWNSTRPKKVYSGQLDNQMAQDFLRTPPHRGVNFRG